ncbi:MAG: Asp-tRNA(Asn)/Glu-tRNA(Gln) amidotransferase subunit GatC, partial [Polyangiales bacterium]
MSPAPAQVTALAADLSRILDYVAQLAEVDTGQVEATGSTVHAAQLRADALVPSLAREDALQAAPASRDGGFAVPRV